MLGLSYSFKNLSTIAGCWGQSNSSWGKVVQTVTGFGTWRFCASLFSQEVASSESCGQNFSDCAPIVYLQGDERNGSDGGRRDNGSAAETAIEDYDRTRPRGTLPRAGFTSASQSLQDLEHGRRLFCTGFGSKGAP